MRLASYRFLGLPSYGAETGGKLYDLPALYAIAGRAGAPCDMLDLIRRGAPGLADVAALMKALPEGAADAQRDLAKIQRLPPVVHPPKFLCIGRNYAEHAKEAGFAMSELPIMFNRYSATLIGHGANILYPKVSEQLDWEGELAVVLGMSHRGQVAKDAAMHLVFGYTAFNDVTVRDYQFRTTQYIAGKNFRTSGPLGPVIVTKDELTNPHNIQIRTRLNGQTMQDANTSTMYFDIPAILHHVSEFIDLEAGDIIAMGTPAGVGFKRQPPVFMKPGDQIEVELDGIGILANRVVEDR